MDGGIIMVSERIRQRLEEKSQRLKDVIAVKQPDRVPSIGFSDMFYVANQTKLTYKDILYKPMKAARAWFKVFNRYDFDLHPGFFITVAAKLNDKADHQAVKYPGAANPNFRLGDNQPFQYLDNEWMTVDEYKYFNTDMTGFLLRELLPRQNPGLAGFSKIPAGCNIALFGHMTLPLFFMEKDVRSMVKRYKLRKTMMAMVGTVLGQRRYNKKMMKAGNILPHMCGLTSAPFDTMSTMIRGMRGTMLDMRRNPEELKAALNNIADSVVRSIGDLDVMFGTPNEYSIPMSMLAIHRGSDPFMSNEQFEEFYWPSFKRVMEGLIERDYTPMPFLEGKNNDRIPYLAEFAKEHPGKCIYWFQTIDMKKVKEVMGDYVCIRGNVPASLLIAGTPRQVDEYVKQSIDDCGEGGGYMVDGGVSGIPNEARHENVVAMVEATHKYGVYRK